MSYTLENASVLVVDDLKPMLLTTVNILKIFGFTKILTANNGEEAFRLFCTHNPDIIITDWQMEPFDGIELSQKIRKDPASPNPFVPIILMTGYSAALRVMEARDKGITEFLVKPFSAKDLYLRIEQLVERPRRFVDSRQFFGPDRRRRKSDGYEGPRRRRVEGKAPAEKSDQRIEAILKKLQEEKDVKK